MYCWIVSASIDMSWEDDAYTIGVETIWLGDGVCGVPDCVIWEFDVSGIEL